MKSYQAIYRDLCDTICDAKDLDEDDLSPEVSLQQLRLDSLDYVELMVLAKREFGVTIDADTFASRPDLTLGELCQHLYDAQQKPAP